MFTLNDTVGDEVLAMVSTDRRRDNSAANIMSTGDFDEMLLALEEDDELFTDEMVFDFRTGRAFSLGC